MTEAEIFQPDKTLCNMIIVRVSSRFDPSGGDCRL